MLSTPSEMENEQTKIFDEKLLQSILKFDHFTKGISKVVNTKIHDIDGCGKHSLSNTWKQEVKILKGNGEEDTKYIVIKCLPDGFLKEYAMSNGLYGMEIKMYREVLDAMEKLMKENNDPNEILWAECLSYKCYDWFIFEDLSAKGYKKVKDGERLGLRQSIIVLRALAKFHALSVILNDRRKLDTYCMNEPILIKDRAGRGDRMCKKLKFVAEVIRLNLGEKYFRFADQVETVAPLAFKTIRATCQNNSNPFRVLNHGDCWHSNMLFKYDEFTGKACGVKFVDFQISHFNTYAMDLQYFMGSSVGANIVGEKTDVLFQCYHDALLKTFERYNHKPKDLPSLENIKNEMEKFSFFGIIIPLYLAELMVAGDDTGMQAIFNEKKPDDDFFKGSYLNQIKGVIDPHLNTNLEAMCKIYQ